jgi:integrase
VEPELQSNHNGGHMKTKYPKVTYSLFQENNKYVVKIHNPTNYKDHPVQIKRTTGQKSERPARRRALEIIDSFFSDNGLEAIKNKGIETVSDMLDEYYSTIYLENIKIHSEEKQKKNISGIKGRFKHLKRHIGHLNPKALDMNAINKYIKLRREDLKPNGDHYSDGSINYELNLLKSSVKVLGNGLKFNIKANIKDHIKLKQIEREVVLTDEQLDAMIEKFAEYDRENKHTSNYAFFLEVLYFTGIRWGQLQLLEYADINFEKSRLEFPPEKTKHEKTKKHLVSVDREILIKLKKSFNSRDIIHSECNCSQAKTCKIMKSDYVFVNKHRRCEHFHKDMFYILWNQFCEDLGHIKFNKFKKGEQETTILPHDIRRTRIVNLIEQGWDRSYIMAQTGHRSHTTFDKYNIVQEHTMQTLIEEQRAKEAALRQQKVAEQQDFDEDYNNTMESIWGN